MEEQFYTILTSIGKAKIANSNVLGSKLNLTKFIVGDSSGIYYNPTEEQTELKNKVWEGSINSINIDKNNPNWIVIETVIPSDIGGFTIREAGILDNENNLIAVAKYPETYKPLLKNGSSKDIILKIILEISNASNVTLKVDPSVTIATKQDVLEVLKKSDDRLKITEANIKNNDNKLKNTENTINRLVNNINKIDLELKSNKNKSPLIFESEIINQTFYVNNVSGSDSNSGLTKQQALKTLECAFNKIPLSSTGQKTIELISDYTCNEHIFLGQKLTGSNLIVINGNNHTMLGKSNYISSIDLHISSCFWLHILNIKFDNYGLGVRYSAGVEVKNCEFKNSKCPVVFNSTRGQIINCKFENIGNTCIQATNCSTVFSENNTGNASYGLFSHRGSTISKKGTQPTGSSSNETTDYGGIIR